ncbi:hypothetical protein ABTF40_19125, partial [Acinetobacter baumannii]
MFIVLFIVGAKQLDATGNFLTISLSLDLDDAGHQGADGVSQPVVAVVSAAQVRLADRVIPV